MKIPFVLSYTFKNSGGIVTTMLRKENLSKVNKV